MLQTTCAADRTALLETAYGAYRYYPLDAVEGARELPIPLKVLVENVLRTVEDDDEARVLVERIVEAGRAGVKGEEIEFGPARVLFRGSGVRRLRGDARGVREARGGSGCYQPARAVRPRDRSLRHRG